MRDELVPIKFPPKPDWTKLRDERSRDALIADTCWDFDELLASCYYKLRELSDYMHEVLAYFDADVDNLNLTVSELIDLVEKQLRARMSFEEYREYFEEHIATCRFVNGEFNRVLSIYAASSVRWRTPMDELADWIDSARIWFDEAFADAYPDSVTHEKRGRAKEYESLGCRGGGSLIDPIDDEEGPA